jgi:anti-sigma B factor antagonist
MKIEANNDRLLVSDIAELTAANAASSKDEIKAALKDEHKQVDLDLSTTGFVDSSGLGVLISLHKAMSARDGKLRIINPADSIQQILELTRLHRLFEIVNL